MIIGFVTSRLGIAVILCVVFAFAIYGYGTHAYNKGREQEKAETSELLASEVQKARDEERAKLDAERDAVSQASVALEEARQQFTAAQTKQAAQFRAQMTAIDQKFKKDSIDVLQIPTSDLPLAIRRQLAVLRAGRQVAADGR